MLEKMQKTTAGFTKGAPILRPKFSSEFQTEGLCLSEVEEEQSDHDLIRLCFACFSGWAADAPDH